VDRGSPCEGPSQTTRRSTFSDERRRGAVSNGVEGVNDGRPAEGVALTASHGGPEPRFENAAAVRVIASFTAMCRGL